MAEPVGDEAVDNRVVDRIARLAPCEKCGQDFLAAYSCKGRGVCPACYPRRMVEYVFPAVAVRQWVVVFPIGAAIRTTGSAPTGVARHPLRAAGGQ